MRSLPRSEDTKRQAIRKKHVRVRVWNERVESVERECGERVMESESEGVRERE